MSISTKTYGILAVALALLLAIGCTTFTPRTTAPGTKVRTHEFYGIEFVWIPAGTFQMGSPVDEAGRNPDEGPVHTVRFNEGFWISRSEITQQQYAHVMNENPSAEVREELPVTNVSWIDAMAFCAKLSADSGAAYSLPTEAQWEYAARAGTTSAYHFGDDPLLLDAYDWYAGNTPGNTAQFPAQRAPNRWGLYDVHGNVSEWCYDVYAEDYYQHSPSVAPTGPEQGPTRVVRGGSVIAEADACRVAARAHAAPETTSPSIGFRIVRDKLPTRLRYYPPAE